MNIEHYNDLFSWSHPLGDNAIVHQDGAVSCLVNFDGFDTDLLTDVEKQAAIEPLLSFYSQLENSFFYEFHFWREWDSSVCDRYLELNDELERGGEFVKYIRQQHAEHLRNYGMTNTVGLVITAVAKKQFLPIGAKQFLVNANKLHDKLIEHVNKLLSYLPNATIATFEEYRLRILQSYYHSRFEAGQYGTFNEQLLLNEQLIDHVPELDEQNRILIHPDSTVTKVLYLYLYPDSFAGWFESISASNITMHVTQIIQPLNTQKAIADSEKQSNFAEGTSTKKGGDFQQRQLRDLAHFRQYVAEHDLAIIKNAYIINLHGKKEEVLAMVLRLEQLLNKDAQVRSDAFVQLPFFRTSLPGQGYLCPMLRPDHHEQVAFMSPVQVYNKGNTDRPESIRLASNGQIVGINYTGQSLLHGLTAAKTGSGKDVEKICTVIETYGFGVDWYCAEIGGSYKWAVEALGGTYTKIDPRSTVINPLPAFADAIGYKNNSGEVYPLDSVLVAQTVNSLAFLLTDGDIHLNSHQRSAGQSALQLLYAVPDKNRASPNLVDYLNELENIDSESKEIRQAAQGMSANLHSFLDTAEGRIFANDDNLIISEGISGVDLKEVDKASQDLLKFYIVFISLKFNNLAFSRHRTTGILLNEMHKLVAAFPEVIGALISELSRMGRKDAAFVDVVTQGIKEIDVIESEVLNSLQFKSLLYRPDEHDEIASRLALPDGARDRWSAYPNPMGKPYRPGLRMVGDTAFDMHLTFGQPLLDISGTDTSQSPSDLEIKSIVEASTKDPFERLLRFREIKERGRIQNENVA